MAYVTCISVPFAHTALSNRRASLLSSCCAHELCTSAGGLHCSCVFSFRDIFPPRHPHQCLSAWQVRACPDCVAEPQKMAELLGLGDECREGTSAAAALASSCLADNRLNLDVYPDGCHRFLRLFEGRQGEVLQVEFLRLSSNDRLLGTALSILPQLKLLKSLVLKGQFLGLSPSSFLRLPADFSKMQLRDSHFLWGMVFGVWLG